MQQLIRHVAFSARRSGGSAPIANRAQVYRFLRQDRRSFGNLAIPRAPS